jgi:hypothetical protein
MVTITALERLWEGCRALGIAPSQNFAAPSLAPLKASRPRFRFPCVARARRRSGPTRALAAAVALLLAGCGGGSDTQSLPQLGGTPPPDYNGPPPATPDVQSFMLNLWDNVRDNNRCGACHNAGGQTPMFARQDDINLAYEAANTVVNLSSPSDSQMVLKVAGGHNCWLSSDQACVDILTTWITNWAGAAAVGGRQIVLEAPPIKDVGASRTFPADSALFAGTVYPVLTDYCTTCHSSTSTTPQQPFFADPDVATAYDAVKTKINLDDPPSSRLVVRLRDEFHNCWSDCAANSAEMQAAIEAMAAQITPTQVDPSFVVSKALQLYDGTIASGGNRHEANQIALWEFKEGQGTTAFDTSGVDPAINLTLAGDVAWVGGWGIDIRDGKAQGSTAASKKLHDLIRGTGEYSIEAWAAPGNVTQEDARIVSYSAGTTVRNFTLGQTLYNYEFFNRASTTDSNGDPQLSTPDADEVLQATLQHVVMTYDPVNGRLIYVNGELRSPADPVAGGNLNDWDDTFALVLGNEVSNDRQWRGVLRLVAIHNRALTQPQIAQNMQAGVGEKFFLLFSVSSLVNLADAYILFEVSQFDSYSYLFNKPTFILLDADAQPGNIPLRGMRIGVNGAEAPVGQSYVNLDTAITDATYTSSGQTLSTLGTVIPLEQGPDGDEFFLTFEVLGTNTDVRTEPAPLVPPPPPDGTPKPDIGLRVFDEINASMAAMTGVSSQDASVRNTYQTIRQQLPTVESIEGFLSAHQVAVSQLAIEYCNALVDDTALRASYFPGFNFGLPANQAFDTAGERDLVLDPLLARVMNSSLATQPDVADVKTELGSLITRLTACGAGCAADRTPTVVKAVCSGALGSAAMLLQ